MDVSAAKQCLKKMQEETLINLWFIQDVKRYLPIVKGTKCYCRIGNGLGKSLRDCRTKSFILQLHPGEHYLVDEICD